ncbi:Hypothetical predicted protein [Mytilus galloprovincialis]|uniref:Uncharacterized protein n=1 Tax=Mytilus galloprovincialis TaxID=29158 RepID=A0A8B6ES26_MYTGA|nr:Hypothetical predicted protein [Mytilus galloprovincialis]
MICGNNFQECLLFDDISSGYLNIIITIKWLVLSGIIRLKHKTYTIGCLALDHIISVILFIDEELILSDYYMAFFLSYVLSAVGSISAQEPHGPRTDNICEVRNSQNSTGEESMVDGIMNELQGICLPDNNNKTVKEIIQDTQTIINSMKMYKEIVKLNKQLKDEIQWIIKESGDEQLVSRLLGLIKRDVKGKCYNVLYIDS